MRVIILPRALCHDHVIGVSCLYNGIVKDKELLHQYLRKDPSCDNVVRLLEVAKKDSQDLDNVRVKFNGGCGLKILCSIIVISFILDATVFSEY